MRGGREGRVGEEQVDVDPGLVDALEALASTNRLRLLSLLEEPMTVAEIELPTSSQQRDAKGNMTQQGVRHHIGKLSKAGLVETRSGTEGGRRVHAYLANPRGLYELAEILRRKASGRLTSAPTGKPPRWNANGEPRPRLRVLHGAEIGLAVPLSSQRRREDRGWIIGRGDRVDVNLDWDPNVDRQAGEIEPHAEELRLIDLRATRNRLSLEGERMEPGETRTISDGDVIGVGRSLLRLET